MPGVVGVGLVQCKLSPEKDVMIRSWFVPFSSGNELGFDVKGEHTFSCVD